MVPLHAFRHNMKGTNVSTPVVTDIRTSHPANEPDVINRGGFFIQTQHSVVLNMPKMADAFHLYSILKTYSNNGGNVHPKRETLAAHMGYKSTNPIDKYLKQLAELGLVGTFHRWRNEDHSSISYVPDEKHTFQTSNGYILYDDINPSRPEGWDSPLPAGWNKGRRGHQTVSRGATDHTPPRATDQCPPGPSNGGTNNNQLNNNHQQPPIVPLEGDAADAALAKEIAGEVIEESTDGQAALFDDQPGTEVATIDDRAPVEPSPAEKPAKKTTRGARLPEGWMPAPASIQRIHELFPGVSRRFLELEHETFCNYWAGVPGAKGLKLDWEGTWRNWLTKALRETPPARWQDPASPAAVPVVSPKIQGYADALQQVKAQYAAERARGGVDV